MIDRARVVIKRMRWHIWLACSLLWVSTLSAERLTIVYGDYPPFYMGVEPDGKTQVTQGMLIDFLKEFSRQHPEYTFNHICLPRRRMDAAMLSGEAQVFSLNNPMFVKEDRERFLWTIPIWHTRDVVVTLKGKEFKFDKPEDLFGKTLGRLFGNGYGEYDRLFAEGRIKVEDAKTTKALAEMALAGRTDGFLGNTHATPYQLKQAGLSPARFTFSAKPIFAFDLMMQINENHPAFLEKMNAFITRSKRNGFLKRIEDNYLK